MIYLCISVWWVMLHGFCSDLYLWCDVTELCASPHCWLTDPKCWRVAVRYVFFCWFWFLAIWQLEMDEGQAEPHHAAREGWGVERKTERVEGEGMSLIWRWTAEWMEVVGRINDRGINWVRQRPGSKMQARWLLSSIYVQLLSTSEPLLKINIPVCCALGAEILKVLNKSFIIIQVLNWCVTQTDVLVCLAVVLSASSSLFRKSSGVTNFLSSRLLTFALSLPYPACTHTYTYTHSVFHIKLP